jgi:hypothetical protein
MLKVLPGNRLVSSPAYGKILESYNRILGEEGKVNDKKFYEEYVKPEVNIGLQSWYYFLKRFRTAAGIVAAEMTTTARSPMLKDEGERKVAMTMMTNHEATAKMISRILNISADAAQEIIDDPTRLTPEKRVELGLKIMKAQDSRIHAVGKLREDNREQEKFERTFNDAQF